VGTVGTVGTLTFYLLPYAILVLLPFKTKDG